MTLDISGVESRQFLSRLLKSGEQDSTETPFIRAERSRLRDWLLTKLPVQWDKHVTRIEHDDDGASINFQDGTSARGDIVVGADGVYSVGRFINSTRRAMIPSRWLT